MYSPWKRFWLELFTSKSWDNGRSVGRFIWILVSNDMLAVFVMLYRIFYKDDEWSRIYHFLTGLVWLNLIIFLVFFLLIIHSIFKEKRGKQFLALLAESFKAWRHK